MNRLSRAERAQIISCLVEGNSIRSTVRMTGFALNTITKLLRELGTACTLYQDAHLRNLPASRVECDEIWAFCHAKARNVPVEHRGERGYGDVWTWTAIDPDTKVMCTWLVGNRDAADCTAFMVDLAGRLTQRVQITTDGFKAYIDAIDEAFRGQVDYAMLVKEIRH